MSYVERVLNYLDNRYPHQPLFRQAVREVLSPRERCVIELRYGLIDGQVMPQREVGKRLCISRSYVSRIEKRALEKLNDCLSGRI